MLEKAEAGDAGAIASLNAYKLMATRSRTDEQMGLVMPSDVYVGQLDGKPTTVPMFSYEYVTPKSGDKNTDANVPIVRHKLDILTSTLADFIQMGHTTRGAQNLADTKVDLFMASVEGWLNSVAAILNNQGLARIWALNGMDEELMPEFVPDMAQQVDLDILSNFILRLSQAGVQMFPDADLEDYIRDAAGLPDAQEDRPWEAQLQAQAGEEPEKDKPKTAAKAIVHEVMKRQLRRKRKS